MPLLARLLVYLGVCASAVTGSALTGPVLLSAGVAALPQTADVEASPRIATWLERQSVAMPAPPQPHGPAFTDAELRALTASARRPPTVRFPIAAMAEPAPPDNRRRARTHSAPRPPHADAQRRGEAFSASARPSPPAYRQTARERYAPERNN